MNTSKAGSFKVRTLAVVAATLAISAAALATTSAGGYLGAIISNAASEALGSNGSGPGKNPGSLGAFLGFFISEGSSSLNLPRSGHTATRLSDGRVLFAGGDDAGTAEIFDPSDSSSVSAGSLSASRTGHTATLLSDGRVLIAGGEIDGNPSSSTEFFDPSSTAFSAGPEMAAARSGHTATVLGDGRVLLAGGGTAEIFDPADSSFSMVGSPMEVSRTGHSAALMADGRVFFAGGEGLVSAEIFDPASGVFSAAGNGMQHARSRAVLRLLPDGKIQIIGGGEDASMEVYDPAADTIGAHGHLIPTDDEHDALLFQHILTSPSRAALFVSGSGDAEFDRSGHTITELGGQAIVAGGANGAGSALNSFAVYASSDASVTTDKLDYQPGDTALISGFGWAAGETVDIIIHEDPHTHTERRLTAVADSEGNFTANYLVEEHDLNVTFVIGAKGMSSGRTAQTTFTDGNLISVSLVAPTNVSVSQGGTANYTINVDMAGSGGGCLVTLSVDIPLPEGVTANIVGTNPTNATNLDFQRGLTLTTTLATPTGSHEFTVRATRGQDCQGSMDRTTTGTLTVTAANAAPTATNVAISGTAKFAETLTGNYTYNDAENDTEGTSTFRWLRNGSPIPGATGLNYTTVEADIGQNLVFEVTPVASAGTSPGAAVQSAPVLIGKADSTTVLTCPASVTYDGTAQEPCSATVTGNGGLNEAVAVSYSDNTNAGTAGASATFAETAAHLGSTDNKNFTIAAANADCSSISGTTVPYDGQPHGATGSCKGVDGLDLAGLDLGGSFTDVPGGTANWVFTAPNANYNNANSSVEIVIVKADPFCSITGYGPSPYDGAAHGATGSCTGVGGPLDVLAGLDLGASFTNVPGGTADWVFTDVTGNYNDKSGSVSITILQKDASVTANDKSRIYGVANPSLDAVVTGEVAGGDPILYTLSTTATVASIVGEYPIEVTLGANPNYSVTPTNGTLTITTAFCFDGFHSPIGGSEQTGDGGTFANPVKSFKLGSTVPVKFTIFAVGCGGTPIMSGIHTLQAIKYSNETTSDPAIDASPTDSATTGNQFRLTSDQWHFNLSTKGGFSAGKWLLKATLQDGSTYTVWIAIKK
ncbi:MAG TPA: kelch repeat-containing protein [Aridibacter sp.]|nr:kelch repeat-containing protein [Aridibacter sp.]